MIEASERQNLVDRIRLDHEFHERICLTERQSSLASSLVEDHDQALACLL